jgi:hypothetical protein
MDSPSTSTFDNNLAKYTNVDLTGFVPPNIIFHQASNESKPQAFQFDVKRIVYDKDLSAPNMQGTRALTAKMQLPDSTQLVDLYVETPVMQSLWGLSAFHSENSRNGKTVESVNYSLQLSFNDMASNRRVEDFYKAMYMWDQHILNQIFVNKQKWLPGTNVKSVDGLEALFTGVCTPRKRLRDGQLFPPALVLRVAKKGGQLDVTCIDKNGEPFDIMKILPSTNLRVVFRHQVVFKSKSIEVRNEPVLIQVMEAVRPTAFAHDV